VRDSNDITRQVSERMSMRRRRSGRNEDDTRFFPATKPKVRPGKVDCEICHDAGWLQTGKIKNGSSELVRCGCRTGSDARRLAKISGVLPHEQDISFGDFVLNDAVAKPIQTIQAAIEARQGFITLYGADTGTGKSALLKAAVNAARKLNLRAAYRRLSHLLQELRHQYGAEDEGFQRRWDLLIDADVLAVDEIEKWNPTAWAVERFDELIDDRYCRLDTHVTLLAGNTIDHLADHNRSRVQDLRARLYHIEGADVRREER